LAGLSPAPAPLGRSALVVIDAQNTYTAGVMRLEGVEAALAETRTLIERARALRRPVLHIVHDDGPGSLYDINAEIGRIVDTVAPRPDEPVIVKTYPSSFERTDLADRLRALGVEDLVLAGFMTHMCVNSTARAAFNHDVHPTVVAAATATRALPRPGGGELGAAAVHDAALAALADLFAVVVPRAADIPD
jgi:nicotinamidase-related amidase